MFRLRGGTRSTAKYYYALALESLSESSTHLPTPSGPSLHRPQVIMNSPRLPLEVIEQVIDGSADHPKTLQHLALTCCRLRPRARLVMFARVRFKNHDQICEFVDFLQDNPHLKLVVRSITMPPIAFPGPSLLSILPNLSSIKCAPPQNSPAGGAHFLALHHTSLACSRRIGRCIQTLCLSNIFFRTSPEFIQLLLAFQNITHLFCDHIGIKTARNDTRLDAIRERLSKQMRLKALTVSVHYSSSVWLLKSRNCEHDAGRSISVLFSK